MFCKVATQFKADAQQSAVIQADERLCLVFAGAGTGKTTTMAAKVKYLVEKEKKTIKPSQILMIVHTKMAEEYLRAILSEFKVGDCCIKTFPAVANMILGKYNAEKCIIADPSKREFVIQRYLRERSCRDKNFIENIQLFFPSRYSLDLRDDKHITQQGERVRSQQEVQIADFLYKHGIQYEYEPIYDFYFADSNNPYTPDFKIWKDGREVYIEHFALTESGENNQLDEGEKEEYKTQMDQKIKMHNDHGTTLITTYSGYNDGKELIWHLEKELKETLGEFTLRDSSCDESEEEKQNKAILTKMTDLVCEFIKRFKKKEFTAEKFTTTGNAVKSVRTKFFLDICECCYLEYQQYLKENNAVDFEDMLYKAVSVFEGEKEFPCDFKYIFVDDCQELSCQEANFIKSFSEKTSAEQLMLLGDDLQFCSEYNTDGNVKLLRLEKNYRNPSTIMDIARNFIRKNGSQVSNEPESDKNNDKPVIIYTYDDRKKYADNAMVRAVETVLGKITESGKKEAVSVLLLGRYKFDVNRLIKSDAFKYTGGKLESLKYPELNITFMTVHASKGLEYDNVIVINGRNGAYGFPCKIEDDPVFMCIEDEGSVKEDEERRLFYIALTRSRHHVYFVAPKKKPSEFLLELKGNYGLEIQGNGNMEQSNRKHTKFQQFKRCPVCQKPLYREFGKDKKVPKLYICTNDPKECGFVTNDYEGKKPAICKCDKCHSGYLKVKHRNLLGCTNYKKDGTGCNNTKNQDEIAEEHGG